MPEIRVKIASSVGLHARPASVFVKAAAKHSGEVLIGRPGTEPVDARSMLSVLSLAIGHGEEVVLRTDGENADAALTELSRLLVTDLDA
ncbi:HPr family phosphocarrier protein [Prauserella sp. PE36]|uniref:Phosphocarrier protein HPr n=1 Tax=Prauserella endophytica TaxID=1592324 RepID=A0ABY2S722_9PSEU|nr:MULTISPECIES: HPr family phosphocarrier protein [Prauserella]PXY21683.1 dihydroxyacetone kinase [Prauserella coralliicola]RBM20059.1 HPr family phosphocarrier protein [Prauserella sp. PE36]TKG71466.1 HPr family phosphocarrier protein [Prauserella endophytica]